MKGVEVSLRTKWSKMDRALRISTIMGLVSGGWVLREIAFEPRRFGIPSTGIDAPIDGLIAVWFFFLVGPLIAFVGALALLLRNMTKERSGIVGFIVFISSLPPISLLLILLVAYITGRPAFPS